MTRAGRLLPACCATLALAAVCSSTACAKAAPVAASPSLNPTEQLRREISAAISAPGVRRGAWGISVYSLERNEPLFELNAETLLVPASTSKLVALAAAVEAVGWDYRYETTLRATGPVSDGVLLGDLVVVGSGDPAIEGRGGDDLTGWIDALKALGISRIEGRIIGDDDDVEEPRPQLAWAWDDLGYTSGAIFGALNLAENRLVVTVSPGSAAGSPTRITVDPQAAYRPLHNSSVTGPPGSTPLLWPEQRPGVPFLTIAGSIPVGAMPVPMGIASGNPTFWFASVLRNRLIRAGIEVTGEPFDVDDVMPKPDRAASTILHVSRSRPLSEIAQPLLKNSINLYGEAVLRLNADPGVFPTNDAALDGLRRRLNSWGIADDAWQIIDGSGLSRRNSIAPDVLVSVLRRMYDPEWRSPWMTALPVAGMDGTLAARMRGTAADGTVRAKTGTMSNIRSLAGYVRTRDNEPLAFSVIVDNFEGSGAAATEAVDRIAVALAGFSRIR